MASRPASARQTERDRTVANHQGFLGHAGFRWLKVAGTVSLICLLTYVLIDVQPRHSGGTWYGYTLGTIGALLICWLTALGYRKRRMTRGHWSLKAWTSAHVYLGLSLIVIATLHTGFQLGWNVHTLAYALMMLVIASGVYGVIVYAALPRALSANRAEMTQAQMLDGLRSIDRQLHDAAQPLPPARSQYVLAALEEDPFGGGLIRRLSGHYPACRTRAALDALRSGEGADADRVLSLLDRRVKLLDQLRRHLKIRGLLEIWLYVHVPLTIALLAALTAHIISVFYYW